MKLKLTSAVLVFLCFVWLSIQSGAVPVLADDGEADKSEPYISPSSLSAELTSTETSAAAEIPAAVSTPTAAPSPTPSPEISPEPTQAAASSGVSVISTTITSDDLIDNDTDYDVDAEALLAEGVDLSFKPDSYQILIIHTHATEAYTPDGTDLYEASDEYRTTDTNYSVVRVGQALADALGAYGLNVLHDCALYDYPSYNGSYVRCGVAVEEYLSAYPDISMVIDLHRDALGSGDTVYKTVTEAEGSSAAQIMFVMGSDVNLENPHWRENLKLALTLQTAASGRYPALMRPTVLCDYRYNQQLSPGYLLMEVGTAGNTLQEAITAVQLFADAVGPSLAARIGGA